MELFNADSPRGDEREERNMPRNITEDEYHLFMSALSSVSKESTALRHDSSSEMLAAAMDEIERGPKALGNGRSHAKPMRAMYELLQAVRVGAHTLNNAIRDLQSRRLITVWSQRARASRPERAHSIAVTSFEAHDTRFEGILETEGAIAAASSFHRALGCEFDKQLFGAQCQEDRVSYRTWLKVLATSPSLPENVRSELDRSRNGLQCTCGAWMVKQNAADTYAGTGGVRCDFSGEHVDDPEVWHCPREKAPVHPFGFDVATGSESRYRGTARDMRLFQRIGDRLESPDCSEDERVALAERRHTLATALCESSVMGFVSLCEDMKRMKAAGVKPADELLRRHDLLKKVLEMNDWDQKHNAVNDAMKDTVNRLDARLEDLSHDKVSFADEDDKAAQIAKLEEEFNGAQMHADFEAAMKEFKRTANMAKEIHGFRPIDLEDPDVRPIVDGLARSMLQQMMDQLPPMLQIAHVDTQVDWTDDGIKFSWALHPGADAPPLLLANVVPIDMRDILQFKHQNDFIEKYHILRERLAALKDVATNADLGACMERIVCGNSEGMCVVCQEEFNEGEDAVRLKACGHVFHGDCIQGWLLGCKRECPVCKAPLSKEVPTELCCASEDQSSADKSSSEDEDAHLEPGTEVLVSGLRNATQHNGRRGVVVEWMEETERYRVRCPAREGLDVALLSLRLANMLPLPEDDAVRAAVLESAQAAHEEPEASFHMQVPQMEHSDDSEEDSDLAEAIRLSLEENGLDDGTLTGDSDQSHQEAPDDHDSAANER